MKKLLLLFISVLLIGCSPTDYYTGITTEYNTDWTMSKNSTVTVYSHNMAKIQILAYFSNYTTVLNEIEGSDIVTLTYDVPNNYKNLYVLGLSKDNYYYISEFKYNDSEVYLNTNSLARRNRYITRSNDIPTIGGSLISYERERGYPGFENEILYYPSWSNAYEIDNYTESDLNALRALIFEYLPNGRNYFNLPQILASGYYNNDCYAVTTGEEPIIVSQIYKNDGGYHEVETCELYYYYFQGDLTVDEIKSLPKYKALSVNEYMNEDDELKKHHSYTLIYWDEGGSYQFPPGYKIGFMLRSNFSNPVKQGELYFDGRLNNKINKHGHFKSSGLGDDDPRMCWLSVNDIMLMCCEAGTDADFNDVVFEIEGGIDPIIIPIIPVYNSYMFCFEDRNLGDYDMNDVVIEGQRIDNTHVRYTVMATGANDELFIHGIEGTTINNTKEVHSYFNVPTTTFVNVKNRNDYSTISDIIEVNPNFSFITHAPFIYNKTQNYFVKLAQKGEDPHAVMIPYNFKWPKEQIRITNAYLRFNEWGENPIISTDWYTEPVDLNVVK